MCSTFPQIYIVQGKGCLEQHVVIRISDDLTETFFSDQMGVYNQMLSELFPNKKSKKM
jgi:hypothetical protein